MIKLNYIKIESISKFTLGYVEDAENQNDIEKVNTQSTGCIMNILDTLILILKNMTNFFGTFTILLRYFDMRGVH